MTRLAELELDVVRGHIYWVEFHETEGKIMRADLDGLDPTAVITGLVAPLGLAVDSAACRLYWTADGSVQSSSLDGVDVVTLIAGLNEPGGFDLAGE